MIKKGSWVRIKKVILRPEERADNLPLDTKLVPLVMWTKGYLLEDSKLGELVQIKTAINRSEEGILVEESPTFRHDYGDFVMEILKIREIVKGELDNEE
jgi:hypothetical protein